MILWAGGEDLDFPNGGAVTTDVNLGSGGWYHRAGYARLRILADSGEIAKSTVFPGGGVTSAWLSARVGQPDPTLVSPHAMIGLGNLSTPGAIMIGAANSPATRFTITLWKYDGASWTALAAEDTPSLTYSALHKFDLQINYAASGSVNFYVNGLLKLAYSGDTRAGSAPNLDSVWLGPGQGYFGAYYPPGISEIIVATEDTRLLSLVTLAPNAPGDATLWGQTTAGAAGFDDINDVTADDSDLWYTDAPDQNAQVQLSQLPPGSFDVRAVKIAARMSRTGGATAQSVGLGVNLSKTKILGCGEITPKSATLASAKNANYKYLYKITAAETAAVVALRGAPGTSATAKARCLLYADSSGSPGALIATTDELIGFVGGTFYDFPFSSPPTLTTGTDYWLGFISDSALDWYCDNTATGSNIVYNGDTYAGGASDPAGTVITAIALYSLAVQAVKVGAGLEDPLPTPIALGTTWETKERLLTVNPLTGLAFTAQELSGLQINFRSGT